MVLVCAIPSSDPGDRGTLISSHFVVVRVRVSRPSITLFIFIEKLKRGASHPASHHPIMSHIRALWSYLEGLEHDLRHGRKRATASGASWVVWLKRRLSLTD